MDGVWSHKKILSLSLLMYPKSSQERNISHTTVVNSIASVDLWSHFETSNRRTMFVIRRKVIKQSFFYKEVILIAIGQVCCFI